MSLPAFVPVCQIGLRRRNKTQEISHKVYVCAVPGETNLCDLLKK